jgi:nickel superoxide dismutase
VLSSEHYLGELAGPLPVLDLPIPKRRLRMKKYVISSVVIASLGIVAVLFAPQPVVQAHCQVPCGIYNDHGRIDAMLEDVTTITKAISQIQALSGQHAALSFNQAARWVNTKEEHASHIITTVAEYFLTQKVKAVAAEDPGYQKYLQSLALHHGVMRAAMKTKQTVSPEAATELRAAVEELGKLYPKK